MFDAHNMPVVHDANISGKTVTLENSVNYAFEGLKLYGESTQSGIPTPENPIEIIDTGNVGGVWAKCEGINLYNGNLAWSSPYGGITSTFDGTTIRVRNNHTGARNANSPILTGLSGDLMLSVEKLSSTMIIRVNDIARPIIAASNQPQSILIGTIKSTDTIRFSVSPSANGGYVDITKLQVCKGSSVLPYKPYYLPSTISYPTISLGGLPDAQDYIDLDRGVLVQQCYKWLADGTKTFEIIKTKTNTVIWRTPVPVVTVPGSKVLCSRLIGNILYSSILNTDLLGAAIHPDLNGHIYINLPISAGTTEPEVKEYMNTHPMLFQYKLATPIETPLDKQTLRTIQRGCAITSNAEVTGVVKLLGR